MGTGDGTSVSVFTGCDGAGHEKCFERNGGTRNTPSVKGKIPRKAESKLRSPTRSRKRKKSARHSCGSHSLRLSLRLARVSMTDSLSSAHSIRVEFIYWCASFVRACAAQHTSVKCNIMQGGAVCHSMIFGRVAGRVAERVGERVHTSGRSHRLGARALMCRSF